MSRFRSGRVSHQNIGIASFTDDKMVLSVTGHANIAGILTVTQGIDAPSITVTGAGSSISADDIDTRNLIVSGIGTFLGKIGAGDSLGSPGQYLKCTEDGVTWASFGGVRNEERHIATAGQTLFAGIQYNPFFTDIYVNGVKLTDTEYSAPGGNTFTLNTGSFAGDVVEIISFNTDSVTNGAGGGSTLGVSTTGTSLFNHINATGVVTAFQFHGDGSNLTGINTTSTYAQVSGISTLSEGLTGSPNVVVGVITATEYRGNGQYLTGILSGIEFQDQGTTVGTAGTVSFVGNGVTATYSNGTAFVNIGHYAGVAGVATVATNAQGLVGSPSITVDNIIANNVSIAQTLTYEDVTNIDSVGLVTARTGVRVNSGGINVAAGVVTSVNGFEGNITGDCYGNADTATNALGIIGSPNATFGGITAAGVNVTGLCSASTFVGNLVGSVQGGNWNGYDATASNNVSAGASITAATFYGDGSKLSGIVVTDDAAPSNPADGSLWWKSDEGKLKIYYTDVDSSQWVDASPGGGGADGSVGSSDLLNDSTPQLGGNLDLNNYNIGGTGDISANGNLTITGTSNVENLYSTGIITATTFYGDNIGNITGNVVGNVTGTINSQVGISTFITLDINGDVDIDGHTNLDNVSIAGVATASEFHGDGQYLTNIYSAPPQGISTTGFTGLNNLFCAGTLEVDKQSILDDVIVSAAATFQGALSANTGPITLNNTTANGNTDVTGITTFRNDVTLIGTTNHVKWNTSLNRMDFPLGTSLAFGNAAELRIYNDGDNRIKGGTGGIYFGQDGSFWVGNEAHNNPRFEATSSECILHSGGTKIARSYTNRFEVGNPDAGVGIAITMSIDGNTQFGGTGIVTATTLDISGNISGGSVSSGSSVTATEFYGDISNATSYPYTSLTGISTDLVGDTTPQLGGNLDVNNKNIEVGDCTTAGTDNTIKVGTSGLEIHHRPSAYATYIQNKNNNTNLWITGQNTSGTWGNIFIRPYLNAFSGVACWWGGSTELYYGNTGSKKLETTSGGIVVTGTVSKSGGNFRIPHPLPSLNSTKDLVHSFIEGPQMDLIYRGKVDLVGGTATVNLDTKSGMAEGTFVLLNRDVQCFTTNETGWTAVKGSVTGNEITIVAQDNSCTDTISWMVVGERQDDTVKSLDMTDSEGNLIVEPDQPTPDTKHSDVQAQL